MPWHVLLHFSSTCLDSLRREKYLEKIALKIAPSIYMILSMKYDPSREDERLIVVIPLLRGWCQIGLSSRKRSVACFAVTPMQTIFHIHLSEVTNCAETTNESSLGPLYSLVFSDSPYFTPMKERKKPPNIMIREHSTRACQHALRSCPLSCLS